VQALSQQLDQVPGWQARARKRVRVVSLVWILLIAAGITSAVLYQTNPEMKRMAGIVMGLIATGISSALLYQVKQERERLAAVARAKAEAEDRAFAAEFGLQAPLVAGARVELGGIGVRWIPAGRFRMGSPAGEEGRFDKEVQHEVELSAGFFMAQTECTQGQWEAVMGSNPSKCKGSNLPVEQVSWEDAVAYCVKLTQKQRSEGVLPEGWKYALPTEAQWEYACRAGSTAARYGELDVVAWYPGNSGRITHPVGSKEANAWGLQDMLGNVNEWCGDWYGDYPSGSVTNPKGPSSGSFRVLRGGSWYCNPQFCRAAYRNRSAPDYRLNCIGFRPALVPVR
jgi:formylglycine-generating enzyme required for sulfatase activity